MFFFHSLRLTHVESLQGSSNTEELHALLTQFMVRRLKKDVLTQLPAKRRQIIKLDIPESDLKKSKDLLEALKEVDLKSLLSNEEDFEDRSVARAASSARNKQRKILTELYGSTGESKAEAAGEYISYILENTSKVIVFAHHLKVLDSLQQCLTRRKVQLIRIDGSVSSTARHDHVKKFQDEDSGIQVALLGLTSAGQGITLTAASTVVFVEMHWTPGVLVQAEDRAHRIGQVNAVNIYYLVAKGSLDDIIWPMVRRKLDTVGKVLDGANRVGMNAKSGKLVNMNIISDTIVTDDVITDSVEEPSRVIYPQGDMRAWLSRTEKKPTSMSQKRIYSLVESESTSSCGICFQRIENGEAIACSECSQHFHLSKCQHLSKCNIHKSCFVTKLKSRHIDIFKCSRCSICPIDLTAGDSFISSGSIEVVQVKNQTVNLVDEIEEFDDEELAEC